MAAAGATATGECDAENVEPPRLQSSSPDAPSGAFGKVVLVNDESLRIDRRKAYSGRRRIAVCR